MLRHEIQHAFVRPVNVFNSVFDNIFVHRAHKITVRDGITDRRFHIDLSEVVGDEEFVCGKREDYTTVIVIERSIDDESLSGIIRLDCIVS
jgi:hypothetical protein